MIGKTGGRKGKSSIAVLMRNCPAGPGVPKPKRFLLGLYTLKVKTPHLAGVPGLQLTTLVAMSGLPLSTFLPASDTLVAREKPLLHPCLNPNTSRNL